MNTRSVDNRCFEKSISVIVPIFNKSAYLRDSLDSILGQTIGLNNIQLVLIDDGSTDGSFEICQEYKTRYPDNIIFVSQENKGVSAARNLGLSYAKGKYCTFFDADDIWDNDAFEKALAFFEANPTVDVVSAKIIQFGDIQASHPLNYKYTSTRLVDLNIEPDFIQPMIGNCIFRFESVNGRLFEPSLHYAEDTLFVTKIILETCKLGVLGDVEYHYRKIKSANTASMRSSKDRYRSNNDVYLSLIEYSTQRFGYVHAYVVRLALYELCWQVLASCEDSFNEEERALWHEDVNRILKNVSDSDICSCRWLTTTKRMCLLKIKHGADCLRSLSWNQDLIGYRNGIRLFSLRHFPLIVIDKLEVQKSCVSLRGVTKLTYLNDDAVLNLLIDDLPYAKISLTRFPSCDAVMLTGEVALKAYSFEVEIPKDELLGRLLSISCEGCGIDWPIPLQFTLYGGLPSKKSYYSKNSMIVKQVSPTTLKVMKARISTSLASECRMCRNVLSVSQFTLRRRLGILAVRLATKIYKCFKKRKIWIFIDREYKAGDNAEALFSYAVKHVSRESVDLNFVLKRSSNDYRRLALKGTVLAPKSLRFYVKFLAADKVLSGHHDAQVTNPFGKKGKYVADMYQYHFYDLSHGTLQGDLSLQLNTHVRPIYRFIVSTQMEQRALLRPEYGYCQSEVRLDGMCRYDIYNRSQRKKKIIILPTWRVALAGKIIPGTREREYVPHFEESDYCRHYNALINDPELLEIMSKYGFTGEFYVHPNYEKQTSCFHGNNVISIGSGSADYTSVLSEGALMISDYSGVTFDFAYLRKPIIYYHFDNLFNGQHSYKATYYDYGQQGFGPVCGSVQEVVNAVKECLENDCLMPNMYLERANAFFEFDDRNNCRRVLQTVMED